MSCAQPEGDWLPITPAKPIRTHWDGMPHIVGLGTVRRWAKEDARADRGKKRKARKDARIKARGTYESGHHREIYRAKLQQRLRRSCPDIHIYA